MSIKNPISAGMVASAGFAALALAFSAQAQAQTQTQQRSTTAPAPPAPSQPAQPMQSTQVGPEELFAHWDKDNNKTLSLDEFKAGVREMQNAAALRALHDNFVAHDINKNNALDAAEYANLEFIKRSGANAPPLSAFDADKNGSLDFKEYVGMVSALVNAKH